MEEILTPGLRVQSLELFQFRNYDKLVLPEFSQLNILIGNNAVGKTNIIEALELLGMHHSSRTRRSEHLIQWGCSAASIRASLSDGYRHVDIASHIKPGSKTFSLQGKVCPVTKLQGILPTICFNPDDLDLVKAGHNVRRASVDSLGMQLAPAYYGLKRDYEKLVRQKNKLLKQQPTQDYLVAFNDPICDYGAGLCYKRSQLICRLQPYFRDFYHDISQTNEKVSISFIPSWCEDDPNLVYAQEFSREEAQVLLKQSAHKLAQEEVMRGRCLVGPHLDKLYFFINGKNAQNFASQGQIRSMVLAYKLAQLQLMEDILRQKPLLLLDDVMSELDKHRRNALLSYISDDIQTVITTTHKEYFPDSVLEDAHVISLPIKE